MQDHVHHLVELMAGEASRSLTDEVTHLVAGEVGSQKYAVSGSCVLLLPDMKNLSTPPLLHPSLKQQKSTYMWPEVCINPVVQPEVCCE